MEVQYGCNKETSLPANNIGEVRMIPIVSVTAWECTEEGESDRRETGMEKELRINAGGVVGRYVKCAVAREDSRRADCDQELNQDID